MKSRNILAFLCIVGMCLISSCEQRESHSTSRTKALSVKHVEAPPYSLPAVQMRDTQGRTLYLSSLYKQRPLVLSVYLGSGCPMCLMNLQRLSQQATRVRSYGWQVVALSNDTPEENRAALTRNSLDRSYVQAGGVFEIDLYSDSNHVAMEVLGCYRRALDTERHGVFLIDQHGVVRFAAIDRRPFEDYEQLFDSIRAISKRTTLATSYHP
jgi:peroxiredoxin